MTPMVAITVSTAATINKAFEKASIFSGEIDMGIFCLIMVMIVVIAGVAGLVGLYRLNRFGFGE